MRDRTATIARRPPAVTWLLTRIQLRAIVNATAADKQQSVLLFFGCAAIATCVLVVLHDLCRAYVGRLDDPWMLRGGAVLATAIGAATSLPIARAVLVQTDQAWLRVLPISRQRLLCSAAALGMVAGTMLAASTGLLGLLVGSWTDSGVAAGLGFLAFASCFGAYVLALGARLMVGARPAAEQAVAPGNPARPRRGRFIGRLLERGDRWRPAWVGHWMLAGVDGRIRMRFMLPIMVADGIGISASAAQQRAFPALLLAVAAGHGSFVWRLRMEAIGSPVLRVSPLTFHAALLGLVRLPLILSAMLVLPPMMTAFAVDPAHMGRSAGYLLVIGFLDLQYSLTLAASPHSRGAVLLIHVVVLVLAAQQAVTYQYVVLLALAAYNVWLWRRARRTYHAHG